MAEEKLIFVERAEGADTSESQSVLDVENFENIENIETRQVGTNSLNMSIETGGLNFKMDTRIDNNAELLKLSGQLELALEMLSRSQSRLEAAFVRIGQLEAELAVLRQIGN